MYHQNPSKDKKKISKFNYIFNMFHIRALTFYSLPVTLRTNRFKIKKKIMHADYIAFTCFVWISEQRLTFSLYNLTDWFL